MTIAGRRKPKAYAEETQAQAQRFHCMDRDEGRCRFEVAVAGLPLGESHYGTDRIVEWDGDVAWTRCGSTERLQCAHIFRKHKLSETLTDDLIPLRYHPMVAIMGCERHHRLFDLRGDKSWLRPPADMVRCAKALIEHTHAQARERGEFIVSVDLTEFDRPLAERVTQ